MLISGLLNTLLISPPLGGHPGGRGDFCIPKADNQLTIFDVTFHKCDEICLKYDMSCFKYGERS